MRGTRIVVHLFTSRPGIIPAYAGNTRTEDLEQLIDKDHPRVCGEHLTRDSSYTIFPGSSPRMRGTPPPLGNLRNVQGIIPAYAGNTDCSADVASGSGDHPRVCGEHSANSAYPSASSGSSPRMRGTHPRKKRAKCHDGIIPAYAGNTLKGAG